MYSIVYYAVVPGLVAGVGFLVNFQFGVYLKNGIDPGPVLLGAGLLWDFFIAPVCVISAFLFLPWMSALIVFPSILLGAMISGTISTLIGDRLATSLTFVSSFAFATFKVWHYLVS